MLEILITIFVIILVPIYIKNYSIKNFLWLSDIGLFLTVFALWLKSPLLISIAAVGILPLEIIWNVDFFVHLFTGYSLCGLSGYMFESKYSYALRTLSLFHVFMPLIWLFYLKKWGYNNVAIYYWLVIYSIILILSYLFSTYKENINWVFISKKYEFKWLIFLMIMIPLCISLPAHFALKHLFR